MNSEIQKMAAQKLREALSLLKQDPKSGNALLVRDDDGTLYLFGGVMSSRTWELESEALKEQSASSESEEKNQNESCAPARTGKHAGCHVETPAEVFSRLPERCAQPGRTAAEPVKQDAMETVVRKAVLRLHID